MYADYKYYTDEYLRGKTGNIEEAEYPFYADKADRYINRYTFDRLQDVSDIPDDVKACACNIASVLKDADTVNDIAVASGGAGQLASYSNDGEGATFTNTDVYTDSGIRRKIKRLIQLYLEDTGLLYLGVYDYES